MIISMFYTLIYRWINLDVMCLLLIFVRIYYSEKFVK